VIIPGRAGEEVRRDFNFTEWGWQRKYGKKAYFSQSQEFIEHHEMEGSDFFQSLKSR